LQRIVLIFLAERISEFFSVFPVPLCDHVLHRKAGNPESHGRNGEKDVKDIRDINDGEGCEDESPRGGKKVWE